MQILSLGKNNEKKLPSLEMNFYYERKKVNTFYTRLDKVFFLLFFFLPSGKSQVAATCDTPEFSPGRTPSNSDTTALNNAPINIKLPGLLITRFIRFNVVNIPASPGLIPSSIVSSNILFLFPY